MEMLVKEHPEMRTVVGEYKRMTVLEKFRRQAEAREKDRRDTWAALEYAKDEGRDEGREEVRAELGKVIEEKVRENQAIRGEIEAKDRENQANKQEIEELRRKLREAGIDVSDAP
jgi:hypothetical protein